LRFSACAMASHGANGAAPPVTSSSKSDFLVNGKYRLVRKIGSGSFGEIYLGINVSSGEVRFQLELTYWPVIHRAAKFSCHECGRSRRDAEGVEGAWNGEGVSPPQMTKGSGERHTFFQWCPGQSSCRKRVLVHFELERTNVVTKKYFRHFCDT